MENVWLFSVLVENGRSDNLRLIIISIFFSSIDSKSGGQVDLIFLDTSIGKFQDFILVAEVDRKSIWLFSALLVNNK